MVINKISLNSDGILLKCVRAFEGNPKKTIAANGRATWIIPKITEGGVVLFLGCWHYKASIPMLAPEENFKREFKSPNWTTSLRFLENQSIVKIDWYGIDKLDQLFEASKFIYKHFRTIAT